MSQLSLRWVLVFDVISRSSDVLERSTLWHLEQSDLCTDEYCLPRWHISFSALPKERSDMTS